MVPMHSTTTPGVRSPVSTPSQPPIYLNANGSMSCVRLLCTLEAPQMQKLKLLLQSVPMVAAGYWCRMMKWMFKEHFGPDNYVYTTEV
jgi:hypothetical protein